MPEQSHPVRRTTRRHTLGIAVAALATTGLIGTGVVGGMTGTAAADPAGPGAQARPEPTMTAIAPTTAPPIGDRFVRTELFFGTDRPGPDVTDAEFQRFVNRIVTPRFPDGLTQYDAQGQFRDSSGRVVQERAKVIVLLYPEADAGVSSVRVEQIRNVYEKSFDQESVLRADSVDRVSF